MVALVVLAAAGDGNSDDNHSYCCYYCYYHYVLFILFLDTIDVMTVIVILIIIAGHHCLHPLLSMHCDAAGPADAFFCKMLNDSVPQ